jgi:membrane protein implicated in regulation of membrane protease activity
MKRRDGQLDNPSGWLLVAGIAVIVMWMKWILLGALIFALAFLTVWMIRYWVDRVTERRKERAMRERELLRRAELQDYWVAIGDPRGTYGSRFCR